MEKDVLSYMGYEWIAVDGNVITIGLSEDGVEEFGEVHTINLPTEEQKVQADEICGELDTDEGPLNLYSPVDGVIVEVNTAVLENPQLIVEDPIDEGWLIKVEANNIRDLANLSSLDDDDDELDDDLDDNDDDMEDDDPEGDDFDDHDDDNGDDDANR